MLSLPAIAMANSKLAAPSIDSSQVETTCLISLNALSWSAVVALPARSVSRSALAFIVPAKVGAKMSKSTSQRSRNLLRASRRFSLLSKSATIVDSKRGTVSMRAVPWRA